MLNNPKFSECVRWFEQACFCSREHSRYLKIALDKYGDGNGRQISGVGRDHFPDDVKDTLRDLARAVRYYSDRAYAARPPRVRMSTIRKIGQIVAQRDGAGFYGPQP